MAASRLDDANGNHIHGGAVDPVAGPGIQLVGNTSGPLTIDRDRTYVGNERKFLGEAIRDFIQILDGPVYRLEHSRNFSVTADWGTIMTFSNEIGRASGRARVCQYV